MRHNLSNFVNNGQKVDAVWSYTSTNDVPRSGRPSDATTPEMIKKILHLAIDNRKLKVRLIFKMVNISTERVNNILHNRLNMRKLCARWVPGVLTDQQKLKMFVYNMIPLIKLIHPMRKKNI